MRPEIPATSSSGSLAIPELVESLLNRAERVVVGQRENMEMVLLALICGGHILLEGVPGTAKTLIARTVARLLHIDCKRIQFTPDLMPSDILGTNVFNLQTSRFEFRPGPVFTDILVADEINRTPPKTQSALLEVMEEKTVTIDGVSHPLSELFTVVATQNPVEYEGTYRLPEAQLDRFLLKLNITFPPPAEEDRILRLYHGRSGLGHPLDILGPGPNISDQEGERRRKGEGETMAAAERTAQSALARTSGKLSPSLNLPLSPSSSYGVSGRELLAARQALAGINAKMEVCSYIGQIVRHTRDMDKVLMGASSRAAVHLLQAAKARALMSSREFVIPDDVKRVCRPVLRHRITLQPDAYVEGFTTDDILTTALEKVEVPR
jgi:MoxR-like ATPase